SLGTGEHHLEAGANERVVVDEQDADGLAQGVHGSVARRTKSPFGPGPWSSLPPASATRSPSPTSPVAAPGSAAAPRAPSRTARGPAPGSGSATGAPTARRLVTTSSSGGPGSSVTSTAAPVAGLGAVRSSSPTTPDAAPRTRG